MILTPLVLRGLRLERFCAFVEGRLVGKCDSGSGGECVDWKTRFVLESASEEGFGGEWKKTMKLVL
uniref:Uncharacterized protein n=1 Tax=Medicago truncatula TaxID=3880 RepID=Q2HVP2_MEDTR|nr:hypothetical protein MtrDRAFT_AC148815g22v2 [Medicago truncatula]